jgi:hypothetical protein
MKLISFVLSLGIAIVFAAFVLFGMDTFYPMPRTYYSTPQVCLEKYNCEQYTNECTPTAMVDYPSNGKPPIASEDFCDNLAKQETYDQCSRERADCRAEHLSALPEYKYFRNIFYIYMTIVLLTILASIYLLRFGSIGSGLLSGSIILFIATLIQTFEYWQTWDRYLKLGILGVVLVVLIFVAYKKIEKILIKKN